MARLLLKFESAVIREIKLTKPETTFGRKAGNDIVIDHPTVSGFHGKIVKEGDGYSVEDLNSTNGTYINGQKIKTGSLKNKDQIGVAKHILEFLTDEAPAAPAAAPAPTAAPAQTPAPAPAAAPASTIQPASDAPLPFTIERNSAEPAEPAPAAPRPRVIEELPPSLIAVSRALISDEPVGEPAKPALVQTFGVIKVVSGAVDGHTEIKLKELVTYIGTSDKAAIKIKGLLAPSLAAAISRRPEGYFLKAVKAGYPKVNGNSVKEQVFLENGALIEAGGTNMVFYQTDAKKETPPAS